MTGRFTPFITTGVGWNFVDTNIPTAPPQVGCWWNPWYGYICQDFQETKNVDGFAYQLGAGLRYRLNKSLSLSGSYRMSWLDFPKADGTPTFDGFQLILTGDSERSCRGCCREPGSSRLCPLRRRGGRAVEGAGLEFQ